MALAVRDVAAAAAHAVQPLLEAQGPVNARVRPADADAPVVYAWKVGLAADPGSKADVQRVVPDAQLPDRRRVHRGNEIDRFRVRDVDDVFVGADAVERRHFEARQRAVLHLKAEPGMGESND